MGSGRHETRPTMLLHTAASPSTPPVGALPTPMLPSPTKPQPQRTPPQIALSPQPLAGWWAWLACGGSGGGAAAAPEAAAGVAVAAVRAPSVGRRQAEGGGAMWPAAGQALPAAPGWKGMGEQEGAIPARLRWPRSGSEGGGHCALGAAFDEALAGDAGFAEAYGALHADARGEVRARWEAGDASALAQHVAPPGVLKHATSPVRGARGVRFAEPLVQSAHVYPATVMQYGGNALPRRPRRRQAPAKAPAPGTEAARSFPSPELVGVNSP
eukprot:Rhum_TRINITY_DN9949_c1_g1::Rhum_TRINITY_DN9949_c1_g1_i1::g.36111::m.36111